MNNDSSENHINQTNLAPVDSQQNDSHSKKERKWKLKVWIIINILVFGSAFLVMLAALDWAKQGSGSEFLILVFAPLFFLLPVFYIINTLLLIIYIIRKRPRGAKLITSSIVLILLLSGIGFYVWTNYHNNNLSGKEAAELISSCKADYVYSPNYSNSNNKVEIWSDNNLLHSDGSNWPAINKVVEASVKKCPNMSLPYLDDANAQ